MVPAVSVNTELSRIRAIFMPVSKNNGLSDREMDFNLGSLGGLLLQSGLRKRDLNN